nr:MAG TPA: hypothetical protein [Caudoviricetes sp.]
MVYKERVCTELWVYSVLRFEDLFRDSPSTANLYYYTSIHDLKRRYNINHYVIFQVLFPVIRIITYYDLQ